MFKTALFSSLAFIGASAVTATTYNINQTVGLGNIVGTIETNGQVGTLSQADILSFDLTVGGPGASVELTQADSVVVSQGSNVSATATNLFFDYSGGAGFLLFQQGSFGTGMKYYCNSSVAGTCFQGASAIPESFDSPSAQVEGRVGRQVIGTVAMVPEVASWVFMVVGFGVVGAAFRGRRNAVVSFG